MTSPSQPLLILHLVSELFSVFGKLLLPIALSFTASLFFAVPDQTIEVYRALAVISIHDEDLRPKLTEIGAAAIGLIAVVAVLRHAAYSLPTKPSDAAYSQASFQNVVHWLVATTLSVLPLLACGYGILQARTGTPPQAVKSAAELAVSKVLGFEGDTDGIPSDDPFVSASLDFYFGGDGHLYRAAIVLFAVALLLFMVIAIFDRERVRKAQRLPSRRQRLAYDAAILSLLAIINFTCVLAPVAASQFVGALGAGAMFFVCLSLILTKLKVWSASARVPLITLVILAALVFAHFDLNDNHKIRTLPADPHVLHVATSADPALQAGAAFQEWLAQRKDRQRYSAPRKYPVYIVAAEGGGIYAAYHAAMFLGGLQDLCPAFAHHLFAVSGVSGGSVGAAIFAALVSQFADANAAEKSDTACIPDPQQAGQSGKLGFYTGASDDILKQDFIAPVVAATLFPDFLQRFLFRPVIEFDRARALERSFEDAVDSERFGKNAVDWRGKQNILRKPFVQHWSSASNSPALLLNTTEVGSGRRRIISPFKFNRSDILTFPLWNKTRELARSSSSNQDQSWSISLSTAITLSARFPWLTPAGWFYDDEVASSKEVEPSGANERVPAKIRLVDGAFFENSGVATALDLLSEIEAQLSAKGMSSEVEANLIVLATEGYPKQSYYGFGDEVDPIRALLNTRAARSEIAIAEGERRLNPPQQQTGNGNMFPRPARLRKVGLRDMGYPLPLGWRLSDLTRMLIFAQNGVPSECAPDREYRQTKPGRFDADCVASVVQRELR
jgi:hypothetical protein